MFPLILYYLAHEADSGPEEFEQGRQRGSQEYFYLLH